MNELWQVLLALPQQSHWESAAVLLAIAYLLLAAREKIACWYCALLSTAIYTLLFWDVSLLMESALNVYYMAMAIYGWHQWRNGGLDKTGVKIRTLAVNQHLLIFACIICLSLISASLLIQYTQAAWPYIDSLTTWSSVITTYMVARKYLENWLYWLAIDSICIPLYYERGLYQTALLFCVYLFIVIYGYFAWRRIYQSQQHAETHV